MTGALPEPQSTPGRAPARDGAGAGEWGPTGWSPTAAARAGRHPAARVLALGVGGLVTLVLLVGSSWAAANLLVRTTERDSATLPGRVDRAVIDVHGSVEVRAGATDRVRVERRSTFGLSRPDVTQTLVDGILTVGVTCDGLPGICTNDLTIELPEDAQISVAAEQVEVVGVDGRVEVDAEGGSIELTDLSGPIDVRAGAGKVTGTRLGSDEVRASVGAGAIELTFVRPPSAVEAATGVGSVVIAVPPGDEAYRVDAASGAGSGASPDVTVATDPTSPLRIRASTGAGQVEVRYGPG